MRLREVVGLFLGLAGWVAASPAWADCDSDLALYRSIREQFNGLPACASSGAEQAVRLALLRQGLEVTRRFDARCPDIKAYTPAATFQTWIDGFELSNKETCAALEMTERVGKALKRFQDEADAAIAEHQKRAEDASKKAKLYSTFADGLGKVDQLKASGDPGSLKKAAGILRDLARIAGEAGEDGMRRKFETQAADAEKLAVGQAGKTAKPGDKSSCQRVRAHVQELMARAKVDMSIAGQVKELEASLRQMGCR